MVVSSEKKTSPCLHHYQSHCYYHCYYRRHYHYYNSMLERVENRYYDKIESPGMGNKSKLVRDSARTLHTELVKRPNDVLRGETEITTTKIDLGHKSVGTKRYTLVKHGHIRVEPILNGGSL